MKITGFCPLIVTKDQENVVKLFEELGFEKRHTKSDIEGGANININMKDADGNRVSVASSQKAPQDLLSININVDDFQEALKFFTDHGFVNARGEKITETSSSLDTYLISPSGFAITLTEHKKD